MKDTPIINWDGDISLIEKLGRAKPGRGHKPKRHYLDLITAFDIETTTIPVGKGYQAFMYIWQWQLGEYYTVIGRTWDEFLRFYNRLNEIAKAKDLIIPVFVHNLSYEFQFLFEPLNLGDTEATEIFATSLRAVLYFRKDQFEFRCSQRLANDSLRAWCKSMRVDHQKLEMDYEEKRYPWTELTPAEISYCVVDVISVVECVQSQMSLYGDNIYTLPYTSTGYIRRMVKKEMYWIRDSVTDQISGLHVYRMLRNAYRGGNTHAGNTMTGCLIPEVVSYDRSSSYPDVLMHCKYPVTAFREETPSLDEAIRLSRSGRALLIHMRMEGVKACAGNTCPYISYASCEKAGYVKPQRFILDNGRILQAELIEMTLTDIDLQIILETYEIDNIEILELRSARYGELPSPIKDILVDLYKRKTELKGIAGQEREYNKQKALLNSVYGMMVQRAITPDAIIGVTEEDPDPHWMYDVYNEQEAYDKYRKSAFLNYAWGVWCCAWARLRLEQGIKIVGYYNFVYCDTDSVKCVGEPDFNQFNKARIQDAKRSGAYATDRKGITHYMGVFEKEYTADRFKTLGSKRYAYEDHGELHVTVSGVSKEQGATELAAKGGIEKFDVDFIFERSGHIAAYYNDHPGITLHIDGHDLKLTSNTALISTPYTMGIKDKGYLHIMETAMAMYNRMHKPDLPYMMYDIDELPL